MSDAILALIVAECRRACKGEPDFEVRTKKAMAVVVDGHWMGGDEGLWLSGAIGGVFAAEETTEDERRRIMFSLSQLRALSAAMSGVPVDVERALENPESLVPVPLMKWWHDLKKARKQ